DVHLVQIPVEMPVDEIGAEHADDHDDGQGRRRPGEDLPSSAARLLAARALGVRVLAARAITVWAFTVWAFAVWTLGMRILAVRALAARLRLRGGCGRRASRDQPGTCAVHRPGFGAARRTGTVVLERTGIFRFSRIHSLSPHPDLARRTSGHARPREARSRTCFPAAQSFH